MAHYKRIIVLFVCGALWGMLPLGVQACEPHPGDQYEIIYCQIVNKNSRHRLPTLDDFRRNDRKIQALLLKRPARELGIVLPDLSSTPRKPSNKPVAKTKTPKKRTTEAKKTTMTRAKTKGHSNLVNNPPTNPRSNPKKPISNHAKKEKPRAYTATDLQQRCRLSGRRITCAGRQIYELVANRSNENLSEGVLAADNKLSLPVYKGSLDNKAEVKRYLKRSYKIYLDKMIEVGLGGTTMTYNKFEYIFYDARQRNFDFSNRFEMMFDVLKKDKRTLASASTERLDKTLTIKHCGVVAQDTIVCNKTARNQVYRRVVTQ